MSRSALWRQEGNIKEREQRAIDAYHEACEEGRNLRGGGGKNSSKGSGGGGNTLSIWGPDNDTYHWNPLLLRNTIQSSYFQKRCLQNLMDWNAVIDEIYYEISSIPKPFQFNDNKTPSTAFCLLLRLLTLRMTTHQINLTIKHPDSPYIRCIGFLYIRYICQPEQVWDWIEPYVNDDEEELDDNNNNKHHNSTKHNSSDKRSSRSSSIMTIGSYVRKLFSEREYYGTQFPRLSIPIERDIQVKLLHAERVSNRAISHSQDTAKMEYFMTLGSRIRALYGDDDNPIRWYDAVVDRVIKRRDDGASTESGHDGGGSHLLLKYPKFVVTFPEYGNTETVTLGEIDLMDHNDHHHHKGGAGRGYRDDSYHHHGYHHHGYHNEINNDDGCEGRAAADDLYEEVRRREQETVASNNKGLWGRKPPTTKASLSAALSNNNHNYNHNRNDGGGGGQHRRHRRYDEDDRSYGGSRQQSSMGHNDQQEHYNERQHSQQGRDYKYHTQQQQQKEPPKKRTAEEMAAIAEKKRKLIAKYG